MDFTHCVFLFSVTCFCFRFDQFSSLITFLLVYQVMVGCFIPSNPQEQKTQKPKTEYTTMASPAAAIPISSADVDAAYRGQGQHSSTTLKPNLTASSSFRGENWASSHSIPDSRNPKTDINVSLPVG